MIRQIEMISFIKNDTMEPLSAANFATVVASAIEMEPTRAGQIVGQALLSSNQGNYLWLIVTDTIAGGSWLTTRIQSGLDALQNLATTYQHTVYQVHHERSGNHIRGLAGVGPAGGILRIIDLETDARGNADSLMQATDLIEIHAGNRFGHLTDAMALLEQPEGIFSAEVQTFKLLISHQQYEGFKHKDIFTTNISKALSELNSLAVMSGFNEYQILLSV